ncbi:DUF6185 family protein [Streptomyces sp. HP-A2021]|uniref:DUF6185 family protein n=1 Tax=Streptomyces sp. HP-A2021 TaxID=2927875 RepID=UPI001FAEDF57|nr:DUF6185 family protein [Streptomyces sp. HP-A2021]UOB15403.1 DUF6185 family protein [Streptomyces sp. HP-A2021]
MRLIVVALVTLTCWLTASAEAYRTVGIAGDCAVHRLTSAHASASLRLLHHGRTHSRAESAMTVRVPTSWPLAPKLLMGEDSGAYRQALGCLVREEAGAQLLRPDEWRKAPPRITSDGKEVRIRMETHAWVNERHVALGPWQIEAGFARWTIRFKAPEALRAARWDTIEIDPGTQGAEWARPEPSASRGAHVLVWKSSTGSARSIPEIEVRTTPPWQRAWAARDGRDMNNVSVVGSFLWMVGIAAVATTAVRSARRRPAGALGTPEETSAARRLVGWVWLSPALAALNGFRIDPPNAAVVLGVTLSAVTAVALAALCHRGPAVLAVTGTLGAAAVTSVLVSSSTGALITANLLAQSALLCGALAWARQLSAPHRRPGLPVLVPLSVALAAVLVGCHLWLSERGWDRVSWLSDPTTDEYATRHGEHLTSGLHELAADGASWLLGYDTVLTALAIVALLRARGTAPQSQHAAPSAPDILLMMLLYTVFVTPLIGSYLNNGALVWLQIGLDVAVLGLLLIVGGRRSTLAQRLDVSGRPLREVFAEAHRVDFLHRARQYRELHATLRRLDNGQSDETTMTRGAVERRLRGLHRWRIPGHTNGQASDRLPSDVTVVDVVLAWGPRATWWKNGQRAATYAAFLAAPASALMTWRTWIENGSWEQTSWGAADTALMLLLWELGWVGAGFLLGALWRLLPGRRGPARALGFGLAYALPIGLDALALLATDEGHGEAALDVSLTLLILTVTALAMDLETFRGERRYWPSRLSLLLSVYQMRYLALQAAYLIAQIVAAITIWQFVTDGGGPTETPVKFQP